MPNQVTEYANSIAKQRVASLCLALGWNSAHGSALDVSLSQTFCKTQIRISNPIILLIGLTRFDGSLHQTSGSQHEKYGRTG